VAGRSQVPESALTGHRKLEEPYAVVSVRPGDRRKDEQRKIPEPPDGLQWTVAARKEWERLWSTPQAQTVWEWDSAYSTVVQLVTDFDTWLYCQRASKKKMIVEGSTKQPRLNPLRGEMTPLFARMLAAKRELYLTPRAMRDGNIRIKSGPTDEEKAEAERSEAERVALEEASIPGEFRVIGEDVFEFDEDGDDGEGEYDDAFDMDMDGEAEGH